MHEQEYRSGDEQDSRSDEITELDDTTRELLAVIGMYAEKWADEGLVDASRIKTQLESMFEYISESLGRGQLRTQAGDDAHDAYGDVELLHAMWESHLRVLEEAAQVDKAVASSIEDTIAAAHTALSQLDILRPKLSNLNDLVQSTVLNDREADGASLRTMAQQQCDIILVALDKFRSAITPLSSTPKQ